MRLRQRIKRGESPGPCAGRMLLKKPSGQGRIHFCVDIAAPCQSRIKIRGTPYLAPTLA
jgi:hypothetical protein